MPLTSTAIISTGEVKRVAQETYGEGDIFLRIGNGAAGNTGLFKALAEDYLDSCGRGGSIAWVCNPSRNTQLALLHGHIDLAMTYERDQEALAESEGWSLTAGCVFHDHFVLVGPVSDPAGVDAARSVAEAFARIAAGRCVFHSRADSSATMFKDRSIWSDAGYKPWDDEAASSSWYRTSLLSPADALRRADTAGAYCLTDRSTLLRQTALGAVSGLTVFIEPTHHHHLLVNSCYALYSPGASSATSQEVTRFLMYLVSPKGQAVVSKYGVSQAGLPFFASVEEGCARTRLARGCIIDRKWVVDPEDIRARL